MPMSRRMLAGLSVGALSIVLACPPTSASADNRVVEPHTSYHDTYAFDPGCAGLHIAVTGEVSGVESIVEVAGSGGQAFLDRDRSRYEERWTNTANGRWFTVSGHSLFRETSATFVPNADVPADVVPPEGLVGPVYLFTAKQSGVPFVVTGSAGRTLVRDTGVIVFEQLFDTLGDGKPGGRVLSGSVARVSGPHPGLDLDLCELAVRTLS